jgi:hypothetical protein
MIAPSRALRLRGAGCHYRSTKLLSKLLSGGQTGKAPADISLAILHISLCSTMPRRAWKSRMASVPRPDMGISTTYGKFDRRIAIPKTQGYCLGGPSLGGNSNSTVNPSLLPDILCSCCWRECANCSQVSAICSSCWRCAAEAVRAISRQSAAC